MVVSDKIRDIQSRLEAAFLPSYLEVVDESDQHVGHAGHQGGGRHFAIIISAPMLVAMTRVQAHRLIYGALAELMITEIHALRITILGDH